MSLAKDIVKDNKKILLLTLGLFLMSIVGIGLLKGGFLKVDPSAIVPGAYTQPRDVLQEGKDYSAIIRSEYGDIEIELYEEDSPNAVNSFVFLSGEGFYNGLTFYKVVPDLAIQTGDPVGDGSGGPGYELEGDEKQLEVQEYSVCMANGSQFFIAPRGADLTKLTGYPVIGKVINGFAVVDTIEKVAIDENYRPINDISINSILIIEE